MIYMKRLLASCLALVLLLGVAACGEVIDDPQSTATDTTQATTGETAATNVSIPTDTTTASQSGNETSVPTAGSDVTSAVSNPTAGSLPDGSRPAVPTVPRDLGGIIAYYNAALRKTPMQRTAYTRLLTKVTAVAAMNVLNEQNLQDDDRVKAVGNVNEKKNTPSDLVALSTAQVQSASSRVDGNTAALTIVMKEYGKGTVADPISGTNGYLGTVDRPTCERLVRDTAMAIAGNVLQKVGEIDSQFALTEGKYTITVDTATGKLKSVRFTCTESGTGEAKCVVKIVPIPVRADVALWADMESTYGPK